MRYTMRWPSSQQDELHTREQRRTQEAKLSDSNNKLSFFCCCCSVDYLRWNWRRRKTILFGALSSYMCCVCAGLYPPPWPTDSFSFNCTLKIICEILLITGERRRERTTKTTTSQRAAQQKNSGYWVHHLKFHITYYVAKYHVFNVRLPSSSSSGSGSLVGAPILLRSVSYLSAKGDIFVISKR